MRHEEAETGKRDDRKKISSKSNSFSEALISGAIAGGVAKTVVAPLDRVKLLFQVSSERFSLVAACQKAIYLRNTEGLLSLWKGNSAVIARVIPATAVNYATYLETKKFLKHYDIAENRSWAVDFTAGACAGLVSTMTTHPLDVIRARLAVEPGRGLGKVSVIGMGSKIYAEYGTFRGLWLGLSPAVLGIVPYSGTIWMTNQIFRDTLFNFTQTEATVVEKLACGGLAGLVGQWVTYPLDTIRRRMQVHINGVDAFANGIISHSSKIPRSPSIVATASHLVATEGFMGMFKGFSINWIKGPVSSGIRFTMVDAVDSLFRVSK